jgi:SAM-dependent methyltransferase
MRVESVVRLPLALAREVVTPRGRRRVPEPMVMDEAESVAQFDAAGGAGGGLVGVYELCSRQLSRLAPEGAVVVDLGCGPAQFAVHLARRRPDLTIYGLDLARNMLAHAERNIAEAGVGNRVHVQLGDMTEFAASVPGGVGVVNSTLALHHLPTRDHLLQCFAQIVQVRERDDCAVQLFDLARLRRDGTQATLIECVTPAAARNPVYFHDAVVSEAAAWSVREFRDALRAAGLGDLCSRASIPYPGFQMHWAPGTEHVDDHALWMHQPLAWGDRADALALRAMLTRPF